MKPSPLPNSLVVMNPAGDIARQQADLIVTSTVLMLLIIVPVIVLTLLFAWRYRAANRSATYQPDWDHSTKLELLIWGAPLLIIIALGAITWISTHQLDPFRKLSRLDAQRALPADVQPLEVQVVALDWKWLFIYPQQGVATVNELAAPVDRPIHFKMTSSTVMNSLFIPALAGQIYAMPGMQTELNAVINKPGVYDGFSANYSGAGFSQMRFKFHGLSDADFARWVAQARSGGQVLDRTAYLQLEQPSTAHPVQRFATVEPELFAAAVNRCVEGGRLCMADMMAIDAAGGGGKVGIASLARQPWRGAERLVVAGLCTPADPEGRSAAGPGASTPNNRTPKDL
ncbi:ubiquinol oxidase subunit II [Aquabacterium sp.]|uniref:ubiquinol oxidase subunit II n=1 Tax=Aquabacterium sp. TaxID=1872578 RepID=UPI0037841DC4